MIAETSDWARPPVPPAGPTKSPSGGRMPATGPITKLPARLPDPTPDGAVVWFTKGNAIPPMMTTPGGGNCAAVGRNPDSDAPEKAANSATPGEVLTTPIPPTA